MSSRCIDFRKMFLLYCILFSLMLADGFKDASLKDPGIEKCGKPFTKKGCQLRKIKWFYNRDKAICFRKLTCRNGFDHRLDCESSCMESQKQTNKDGNDLLKLIFDLLHKHINTTTKLPPKRQATARTARISTKTTKKSRFTSSVTKQSPTSTRMSTVNTTFRQPPKMFMTSTVDTTFKQPTTFTTTSTVNTTFKQLPKLFVTSTVNTAFKQPTTFTTTSTVKTTSEPRLIVGAPADTINEESTQSTATKTTKRNNNIFLFSQS